MPASRERLRLWGVGAAGAAVGALVASLVFVVVGPPSPSHHTPRAAPPPHRVATTVPATTPTTTAPTTTTGAPTTTTSTRPVTTPADPREVLAPATVPPESDECIEQLSYGADGNAGPLLCPQGGVNVLAWQYHAQGGVAPRPETYSQVMQLGPYASPTQVYQAMCSDYTNVYGTNPLTDSAETLAAAYYGWVFAGTTPARRFEMEGCPTAP